MTFDETIRLQALTLKQNLTGSGSLSDALIDGFLAKADPEQLAIEMKNICAMVSKDLFDQVNEMCNTLSLSKRRFVEMALVEALSKANQIFNEVQPIPEDF